MRKLIPSRWLWPLSWLVLAPATLAFQEPAHERLADFDQRVKSSVTRATGEQQEAVENLNRQVPGVRVHFDAALGRARHVNSPAGFLSGPQGSGKGVKAGAAAAWATDDPHRPVKAFLDSYPRIFGHGSEALRGARVERDHTRRHNGLRTVVWQQEVDGIPVFEALLVGHTTAKGELVALSSQLVPDAEAVAAASVPNRAARLANPPIPVREAIARAGGNLGEAVQVPTLTLRESVGRGPAARHKFAGGNLPGHTAAKLVWLPMDKGTLRLCWEVVLAKRASGEAFRILVDAISGEVLVRHCLTSYLTEATFRVFTSDSPSPFSPGNVTPNSYQPPVTNRELVSMLAVVNTNASPNGWINDGVFETIGNNVAAHLDRDADDFPDLPRLSDTNRVFDFPLNFGSSPTETNNQSSAVVQLFYWCNWIHDRLYELGFTEANGNFQTDNFGRGGLGSDAVEADAQDSSGFNNANFTTYLDGTPPRMQMYLFSGPFPARDGDFDAEIVIHEYAHGLTSRLVGNGIGISALQTEAMGEGWSDFYALALLSQSGDALGGNYPMAVYAVYQLGGSFDENFYYGIRRYPYSTNLAANPLTLKDIDPTRADPHALVPRNPTRGNSATEVHNMGEVWCVTLWDARAYLVAKHGFPQGNQIILQLVTDALSLSPPNPTFLEARDAILTADLINHAGANHKELWEAFARRGLGASAIVPPSSTSTGVHESFDFPDDLRITPNSGLTSSGPVGGPFNPGAKTYMLTNFGSNTISWTAGAVTNWLALSSTNGLLGVGATTNVLVSLTAETLTLLAGIYTNVVTFSNVSSGLTQSREFILAVGQPDYFTELFDSLDNDLSFQSVTFTPDGSSSYYNACRVVTNAFPVDPAGGNMITTLTDDSFVFVTVTNGSQVSLYGTNRSGFYIGSNGYLTFDNGDTQYYETFATHFNRLRVSGLFADLLPDGSSTISWKQLPDGMAVTWQNLRQYNSTNRNNFQIEMFFDGRIRFTWLGLMTQRGLAGLSRGNGVPEGFAESDLSQYGMCLPPLHVTLPSSATEGDGTLTNQASVSIGLVLTNDVVVQLASGDISELTVTNSVTIFAGQTNVTLDLGIVDDNVLDGSQKVYVMATASGFPSGASCLMVNDSETATLMVSLPGGALENVGTLTNQGLVRVSAAPSNDVVISLSSSNPKLLVPASVTMPAGQTSAVFNLTLTNNNLADGTQAATVTAQVVNWTSGAASLSIFDDETSYDYLDRFQLSTVMGTQYAGAPFGLTVTAKTPLDTVFMNYSGSASLIGLRNLTSNDTVRVLAYVGHADLNLAYANTIAAISSVFTNFAVTTTTNTNSAALRLELADQQVFLVPEQTNAPPSLLNELGGSWSNALREFTARGGLLVVCSATLDEYRLLTESGLMELQRVAVGNIESLQTLATNALTLNVSNTFSATNVSLFTSSNATAVIGLPPGSTSAVAVVNFGLGHAVLIGAAFVPGGSQLDHVIGNAVQWAQSAGYETIAVTPSTVSNFVSGASTPAVAVAQPGSNLFLVAFDSDGHLGTGNLFNVLINHVPSASNLSFTILADAATNLPLAAFDLDGQPLSFSIASLPTNGLLSPLFSTNGILAYTPAHAFTGVDAFSFFVSDGISNSAPGLVNITVLALPDSNVNGLPDAWEFLHGLGASTNSAELDPDGDGLTNFQEYLANSNPNDPTSGLLKPQILKLLGGNYRVSWCSIGGTRYRFQIGDGDLLGNYNGAFIDIARPAALEIDPAAVGILATNSFLDDFISTGGFPAHGHRYYRIKIIR